MGGHRQSHETVLGCEKVLVCHVVMEKSIKGARNLKKVKRLLAAEAGP